MKLENTPGNGSVPKTSQQPENEDEIRPISLIPDMARDYNRWIVKWLEPYISKIMEELPKDVAPKEITPIRVHIKG